ncbi:hypothetical protein AXF42_Ash018756 [Apostasia shenzhenica]|uniref:Reverse transcriptase domain-containing protein n=1 Tax=Apostasia shenzhenica TaxID=1088818 RepID=A0A2I0AJW6_9ASPA|nr:hypothetical protein AXF42_Ash018756 [Apostasia shenzhenica]
MLFSLKNTGATYQRMIDAVFRGQRGRNLEAYVDDILVKSRSMEEHLADLRETFDTLRRFNLKLNPANCTFGAVSKKFLDYLVSTRGIEANPDKILAVLSMPSSLLIIEGNSETGWTGQPSLVHDEPGPSLVTSMTMLQSSVCHNQLGPIASFPVQGLLFKTRKSRVRMPRLSRIPRSSTNNKS